jgi:DNA repair protein RAD51
MKTSVDLFTHIKIHLFKNPSKFTGTIYWALNKKSFSYQIHESGLSDCTEDI